MNTERKLDPKTYKRIRTAGKSYVEKFGLGIQIFVRNGYSQGARDEAEKANILLDALRKIASGHEMPEGIAAEAILKYENISV